MNNQKKIFKKKITTLFFAYFLKVYFSENHHIAPIVQLVLLTVGRRYLLDLFIFLNPGTDPCAIFCNADQDPSTVSAFTEMYLLLLLLLPLVFPDDVDDDETFFPVRTLLFCSLRPILM